MFISMYCNRTVFCACYGGRGLLRGENYNLMETVKSNSGIWPALAEVIIGKIKGRSVPIIKFLCV